MVACSVTLRDVTTGEQVTFICDGYTNEDSAEFMWNDGNYACDCNRALFFDDAKGIDTEAEDYADPPCGDSRFELISLICIPHQSVISSPAK